MRCCSNVRMVPLVLALSLAAGSGSKSHAQATQATRPVQLPLSGRQGSGVSARESAPAPSGASSAVQIQVQGNYSGSVPSSDVPGGTLDLTLSVAVQRA